MYTSHKETHLHGDPTKRNYTRKSAWTARLEVSLAEK